jgi:CRISPR-associated exonuclease Cas4
MHVTSMVLFGLVAVALLFAGLVLMILGRRSRLASGLPFGEVVYSDTGAEEALEAPLISRHYGLVGRPDYLVHRTENNRRVVIPVEVKSRRRPATPHPGHALQLAAYCMLVEEAYQITPPYGLLRYADVTLRIPFDDELRQQVERAANALRRARNAPDVARQHDEPERCIRCGYRHACGVDAL